MTSYDILMLPHNVRKSSALWKFITNMNLSVYRRNDIIRPGSYIQPFIHTLQSRHFVFLQVLNSHLTMSSILSIKVTNSYLIELSIGLFKVINSYLTRSSILLLRGYARHLKHCDLVTYYIYICVHHTFVLSSITNKLGKLG